MIRVPVSKSGPELARVVHQRFTDAQISRALLAWVADSYFGGTHLWASGVPITWDPRSLNDNLTFPGYESTAPNQLSPPTVGSAQSAVTIAAMTCAALLVPWPDGAQTLSVGATGAPGGNLAGIMTAGLDIAPGSPAAGPCGADGQRTVIPLAGNQFTATRPCNSENGTPQMWVFMVNGGSTPLHLRVTAVAS